MNDFTFTGEGFSDYLYWQTQDKKTLKKINALSEDIKYRPGYSRLIDEANRLVYVIDELQNIKIISCRGHYEE